MTQNVSSPNTPPQIEALFLILCSASSPAKTVQPIFPRLQPSRQLCVEYRNGPTRVKT